MAIGGHPSSVPKASSEHVPATASGPIAAMRDLFAATVGRQSQQQSQPKPTVAALTSGPA